MDYPLPVSGFFLPTFLTPKEKTRNRYRCGFPCLLASQLIGLDLWAHHEGKCLGCLHAAQHFKKETKKPAVEGSGLQIQSRGKEETNASYSSPYLYSVSGLLNLA